jgi:hypothetical protein
MVAVLDELGLTTLVTSITGLSPVGAATILAETGDLTRFRSPRSVVKHAGLWPRKNSSGQHQGISVISGRGRPALRLAAWRCVGRAAEQPCPRREVHPVGLEYSMQCPDLGCSCAGWSWMIVGCCCCRSCIGWCGVWLV